MRRVDLRVYGIIDPERTANRDPVDLVRQAVAGGATVIQYRDKRGSGRRLVDLARALKAALAGTRVSLLVNDRVDVGLAAGADGVDLGQDDMHPADARRLLGPERLVGVSVSTVEEAIPLAPFASYLGVGAVFGSTTKGDAGPPVGPERIREIKRAFPDHPIVAIGGIHAGNIAAVAQAGADAAAVVSAVVCAPDMKGATEELVEHLLIP